MLGPDRFGVFGLQAGSSTTSSGWFWAVALQRLRAGTCGFRVRSTIQYVAHALALAPECVQRHLGPTPAQCPDARNPEGTLPKTRKLGIPRRDS